MVEIVSDTEYIDLLVIGGGINGAGIARDASGRGLKVLLCEKDDLAQHTSSSSTKLIHGGLRYLEHYDFALVRHALQEREVLLDMAPHIIWPLRFILPHHKELRPRWLIRLGLFLYDHIGGRKKLPGSNSVNLQNHISGKPLKPEFTHGFEYSDCWVQDARLVVLNAQDASSKGALILTRTECTKLNRASDEWRAELIDRRNGRQFEVRARAVVNAAGPWVEHVLNLDNQTSTEYGVRLVKGSHIVVPRLFDHDYPYIFQNADDRVLFAIPYEKDFTLLGTTDIEIEEDPGSASIDEDEIDYICSAVNRYFTAQISKNDVIWSYSGVRPLFDDAAANASEVTRDYVLQLDDSSAPILSVFGGKITTYRKLSEQVVNMLGPALGNEKAPWTSGSPLPGGDIDNADFSAFLSGCKHRYSWLEECVLVDYARNYGSNIHQLLFSCNSMADLGEDFRGGLYQREVEYLVDNEWAETDDDILWRRTKKGLRIPVDSRNLIQQFLSGYLEKNDNVSSSVSALHAKSGE